MNKFRGKMSAVFKVLKQLFYEFWLPLGLAVGWAFYSARLETSNMYLSELGGAWAKSFFFFSWISGNFNRVKKNQQTEAGLKNIYGRVQSLIDDLEARTVDLVGHITGGNSFCYLGLSSMQTPQRAMTVFICHSGSHNIPDVEIKITDQNGLMSYLGTIKPGGNTLDLNHFNSFTQNYGKHVLRIGQAAMFDVLMPEPVDGFIELKIDFYPPAKHFYQMLYIDTTQVPWATATRVTRDANIIHEYADRLYPREDDGQVNWESHKKAVAPEATSS
jgi:hypothetical protein